MNYFQRLDKAVKSLVKAEVSFSWKGAAPAEDQPELERRVMVARKRYRDAMALVKADDQSKVKL